MDFLDDLAKETRRAFTTYSRNAKSRYVEDAVRELDRSMDNRGMDEILGPIVDVHADEADRCSSRDYDDLVAKLALIAGEAMIITALEKTRDDESLTRREVDDLNASRRKYAGILEEAKELDRRERPRERDRERPRRDKDRDRDNNRGSRRTKRNRDNDNDRHNNSFEREGDEHTARKRPRDEDYETERDEVIPAVVSTGLKDGDVISAINFPFLPQQAKDLPFYFAGIEALVYREDSNKVLPVILDGTFKVNYENHRTDLFLSPNRDPMGVAIKVEDLESRLQKAAAERVSAYIKNETDAELTEHLAKINIDKDVLVEGIYRTDIPLLGSESQLREMIADVTESPDFSVNLVAISTEHCVNNLKDIDCTSEDYLAFIDTLNALAIETKLADIKTALVLAGKIFDPVTYDIIHRLYNEAVCNALSVSLKLGIKTDSVLREWSDIEKLINDFYVQQPHIIPIIEMNLCAALPTIFESKTLGLGVYRNYIFLPVAKSDLTIASPVRYATLNKSNREELYGLVNKLLTTNVPQETYKAYTTLITLDNYSIPLFKNRSLVTDVGYFVFQPIV